MKSKRRHELQTNDLADRLGHVIERIRPYTTMIMLVFVGIVVILAAGYYLAKRQADKQGLAWRYFMAAGTDPQRDVSEQLSEVADDFEGTAAALWASQTAGDLELARGIRMLFTDRALADTSLTQARNYFRDVIDNSDVTNYPMLLRRARFGLAQTHEALGELDKAKESYALVSEGSADDAIATVAKERIARLEKRNVDEFYAWFADQKPVPPAATGGSGTGSPLGDLLDSPGAGLGDLPDGPGDFMSTDFGSSTDDPPGGDTTGPVTDDGSDSKEGTSGPPAGESTESPAKQGPPESGGADEAKKTSDPTSETDKS
jgi:hypothetical protein